MSGAGGNRLPALAKEVAGLHREIGQHATAMAEKALQAGAALAEAKALAGHGNWSDWLSDAGITERTARRYMRLHRADLESATVADLGLNGAERLAGLLIKAEAVEGLLKLSQAEQVEVCLHMHRERDRLRAETARIESETAKYRELLEALNSDDPNRVLANLRRQITTVKGRIKEIQADTKRMEYRERKLREEAEELRAKLEAGAA